jgi:hypothetical protein
MDVINQLKISQKWLSDSIESIERSKEITLPDELLDALDYIDSYYERFCGELDEDFGDEPGTTYKDGVSIEFYIEADWWHKVSLILRSLREINN